MAVDPFKKTNTKTATANTEENTTVPETNPNTEIVATFKGDGTSTATWLVLHAPDAEGLKVQLDELSDIAGEINEFSLKYTELVKSSKPEAPASSGGGRSSAPAASSNGETRECKHGEMVYREGIKNGKTWRAFFCPTPKGTADQCDPDFLRG